MSYGLAEEVAQNRPLRPGPEWWTLLDLAQTARDETRLAWPGEGYLLERAKCSRATLYRRLDALESAGLIRIIRTGRKQRTRYEILPIPGSETARLGADLVSQHGETPTAPMVSQNGETPSVSYPPVGVSTFADGVSKTADGVSATVRRVPSYVPSDMFRHIEEASDLTGTGGTRGRTQGQDLAEWEEKKRQLDALERLFPPEAS